MQELTDKNFHETIKITKVPIVVDFWAPWCGPCRALSPILEKLAAQYGDKVLFTKVNVDDNPTVSTEFGIRSIPNIMIFNDGKKVDSIVGLVPITKIQSAIDKVLDGSNI